MAKKVAEERNIKQEEITEVAKSYGWQEGDLLFIMEEHGRIRVIIDNGTGNDARINCYEIHYLLDDNGARIYWDYRNNKFYEAHDSEFTVHSEYEAPEKWVAYKKKKGLDDSRI